MSDFEREIEEVARAQLAEVELQLLGGLAAFNEVVERITNQAWLSAEQVGDEIVHVRRRACEVLGLISANGTLALFDEAVADESVPRRRQGTDAVYDTRSQAERQAASVIEEEPVLGTLIEKLDLSDLMLLVFVAAGQAQVDRNGREFQLGHLETAFSDLFDVPRRKNTISNAFKRLRDRFKDNPEATEQLGITFIDHGQTTKRRTYALYIDPAVNAELHDALLAEDRAGELFEPNPAVGAADPEDIIQSMPTDL